MLEVVSWYIVALITHILDCYVFSKLTNKKIPVNLKNIFIIIIFTSIDYYVGINSDGMVKMIFTNIITFIILKIIFKESVSKIIVSTIFIFLGYVLADIIMSLIFIGILGKNAQYFIENYIGFVVVNVFDFIFYIWLFNRNKVIKYISKVMNWYDEKKKVNLIINSILIMILCYVILYPFSFNKNFWNYQLLILCIFLGIMIFVIGYFNEKSNNNKLTIEYTQLLEYVKDYEQEIVEKNKRQHEYQNQLIVINDMIPKTNKKLKKFINDKLEQSKEFQDNIWLEKLTSLPSGGIKGLVYYKLKKMIEQKISVYVEIDKELENKNNWINIDTFLEDYTRMLGVYLDNAIEAASTAKDKQIIIEFRNTEDNIIFLLSNTYIGEINCENMDKEKFSTKGSGRGYGLSLVKDIIEKNKSIKQSREINGKFYVQKLYVKK